MACRDPLYQLEVKTEFERGKIHTQLKLLGLVVERGMHIAKAGVKSNAFGVNRGPLHVVSKFNIISVILTQTLSTLQ